MQNCLSITNVHDPLSAGLITMSVRLVSFCRASRSCVVKLSEILVGYMFVRSRSMLWMYESSAGSRFLGGVQVLVFLHLCVVSSVSSFSSLPSVSVLSSSFLSWKKCWSLSLRLKSVKSALSSFQSMLLGVGKKLSLHESSNFSSSVRLITVSVSMCLGFCLLFLVSLRV